MGIDIVLDNASTKAANVQFYNDFGGESSGTFEVELDTVPLIGENVTISWDLKGLWAGVIDRVQIDSGRVRAAGVITGAIPAIPNPLSAKEQQDVLDYIDQWKIEQSA